MSGVKAEPETCLVFADGLRFDVAGMLQERLEQRGLSVKLGHRLAPLPTVTATAKSIVSPAHSACEGGASAEDFTPVLAASKQPVSDSRLRDEIARQGVGILDADETTLAANMGKGGWTEGRQDKLGHSLRAAFVRHVDEVIEAIVDRVLTLFGMGWTRVRLVTDHGWLLVPGDRPKVELPAHLVATKWARCAFVQGESSPDVPTFGWFWNAHARIALPSGIGSFIVNTEYAHGGVSPQECVVPDLLVEQGEVALKAQITEIAWRGMRCRVVVDMNATGLHVELRRNWKQADPEGRRIDTAKDLGPNGQVSLVVERDEYEERRRWPWSSMQRAGARLSAHNDRRGAMSMELDALDKLAASAFDGYLVRKDLVRKYSRQYPVPVYVVEFLLGRYCASVDENEINEGLQIVEKQLRDHTVRTGEEELFKARARESGAVKLIDIIRARLDARNDCYLAELPSLALRDVRIDDQIMRDNERMLTDGFYAEVTLSYDGVIAQQGGRPFKVDGLRPIQMSKPDVLDVLARGRHAFTVGE